MPTVGVTESAASAAGRYVGGGYTAVYDGVVGPWFLPTFAAASGVSRPHYVILLPTLEKCATRVATRHGHGFTDDAATRKMHGEFSRAEIDRRHVLEDPPDDVELVVELILEALDAGMLRYETNA